MIIETEAESEVVKIVPAVAAKTDKVATGKVQDEIAAATTLATTIDVVTAMTNANNVITILRRIVLSKIKQNNASKVDNPHSVAGEIETQSRLTTADVTTAIKGAAVATIDARMIATPQIAQQLRRTRQSKKLRFLPKPRNQQHKNRMLLTDLIRNNAYQRMRPPLPQNRQPLALIKLLVKHMWLMKTKALLTPKNSL